jgi:hypothetical protein
MVLEPVPLVSLLSMVNQSALLVAVQVHPLPVVRDTDRSWGPLPNVTVLGLTENVQLGVGAGAVCPACVTVTVAPATVSVPVRLLVDVFSETMNAVTLLPLLLAPATTFNHDARDTAVH